MNPWQPMPVGCPSAPGRGRLGRYVLRRGGSPVCWVRMRPGAVWVRAGSSCFFSFRGLAAGLDFLRRVDW